MKISEILQISKFSILWSLVTISVCSMFVASVMVPGAPHLDPLAYLHIVIAGALGSAGSSALNNYYDRDIDSKVSRTKNRPISTGSLAASHVLLYGLITSCASVVYSMVTLNLLSALFIAFGIFTYVVIYTMWLKRKTKFNTLIGAITGSTAVWAGWSAATGSMDILGFLLGTLILMWTTTRVWCYSLIIRDEYAKTDIPIISVTIGVKKTSQYILVGTIVIFINALAIGFLSDDIWLTYLIPVIIMISIMLIMHYGLTKSPTPRSAWYAYWATSKYLLVTYIAIAINAALHIPGYRFY